MGIISIIEKNEMSYLSLIAILLGIETWEPMGAKIAVHLTTKSWKIYLLLFFCSLELFFA